MTSDNELRPAFGPYFADVGFAVVVGLRHDISFSEFVKNGFGVTLNWYINRGQVSCG